MKRFTPALTIALMACAATAQAETDLDSLLGDWTANAPVESDKPAKLPGTGDSPSPVEQVQMMQVDGLPDANASVSGETFASRNADYPAFEQSTPSGVAYQGNMVANPYASTQSCSSCDSGPGCQAGPTGCGSGCCTAPCGEVLNGCDIAHLCLPECRPHQPPVLPPPSTLLQYFYSRNSYSAVWAGYNAETRQRLRNRSPYLVGPQQCVADGCGCHSGCASGQCETATPCDGAMVGDCTTCTP
ncbi:MAG: hypothetical protein AAGJ40_22540 [Planctomycetota bacterium]